MYMKREEQLREIAFLHMIWQLVQHQTLTVIHVNFVLSVRAIPSIQHFIFRTT